MAADGAVVIDVNMNVSKAEKELAKLKSSIAKTEQSIADDQKKRDAAREQSLFNAAALDAEKAKLQEIKDRLADIRAMARDKSLGAETRESYAAQVPAVQQELADQRTRVSMLQSEWNRLENSVERYDQRIAEANAKLDRQTEEAGALTQQINAVQQAQNGMAGALSRAGKQLDKFLTRIKRLASRVFVFTLITSALRSLRTWLFNSVKANEEAAKAIAQLKGAFLTLAQPLLKIIIPAFTALVKLLTQVVTLVARAVSTLFGTTIEESAKAAEALYEETNALNGVSKAAKKAEKSMASFDEINQIGSPDSDSDSSGSGSTIAPDFSAAVDSGLSPILEMLTGMALFAVGVVLTFTGTSPFLGLALMALGVAAVYETVTGNPNIAADMISSGLAAALVVIGPMIAVIGVLLAVTGNVMLGLALIISGIAVFEAGAAAGEDGDYVENIKGRLEEGVAAVGGLIAVVGLLLLVMGNIALGLGLFIAGVSIFEIAEAEDDDGASMQEKVVGVLLNIAGAVGPVIAAVGLFLLVTGKLLIGLGMLIAGVALFKIKEETDDGGSSIQETILSVLNKTAELVAPVIAIVGLVLLVTGHWIKGLSMLLAGIALFAIKEETDDGGASVLGNITKVMDTIYAYVAGASAALLAIGLILTLTGVATPLGLKLIFAGAIGLAGAAIPNWETITTALDGVFGAVILGIVGIVLLVIGLILTFTGAATPLGLGLIFAGAVGLAKAIIPNWETIQTSLQGTIGAVVAIVSVALLAIGAVLLFTGAATLLGLGMIAVGSIGLATVTPANWDTIVTALQGPIGTIVAIVSTALLVIGAVLLFTGAGIPLGLGMIAVGAVGLATTIGANWDTIQDALGGPIGAIAVLVGGALLVLGVILLFTGAGIALGLGMIVAGGVTLATAISPNWDTILDKIKEAWGNIKSWWDNTAVPGLKSIPNFFINNVINPLLSGAENFINFFIDGINGLITKLNSFGIDLPEVLGGEHIGFNIGKLSKVSLPRVPQLAQGAVIPPNREFLAVLGDQRSGTNVEAPAELIRQIVTEGIRAAGAAGSGTRDIHITLEVDRQVFAQAVYKANSDETQRVGASFVGVSA